MISRAPKVRNAGRVSLEDASQALREAVEAAPKPVGGAVVGTLNGQPLTADFPLRTVVYGVEAVVIPADEYQRLTAKADLLSRVRPLPARRTGQTIAPSTVERDPEVAAFLRERFALAETLDMLFSACAERFGTERTPSRSRIANFRYRVRRGG